MLDQLRKRREDEEGFTLIELMVVVLIIAILIAIAIPTFLGAQDRARDRGAQSNLRNALTAAKTVATDSEGLFIDSDASEASALATAEPSLTYAAGATSTEGIVAVATDVDPSDSSGSPGSGFVTRLLLQIESASGTAFGIRATREGAVTFCKDTAGGDLTANGCTNPKF